jgi:hypothetical protein
MKKNIVDSSGFISINPFLFKGIKFRIVKTEGYRKNIWNVIDTIRNEKTKKTKKITRSKLFHLDRG